MQNTKEEKIEIRCRTGNPGIQNTKIKEEKKRDVGPEILTYKIQR